MEVLSASDALSPTSIPNYYSHEVTPKSNHSLQGGDESNCIEQENNHPQTISSEDSCGCTKAAASLDGLMKIPVDIFAEIAQYLHPLDLLRLSRVNGYFRDLFMSHWATPIWQSARRSIQGLPPCPVSMCETQYAVLLFTKACSICGKCTSRKVDAILLVRLCSKCCYKRAINASRIMDCSLVFLSFDRVPDREYITSWCLDSDLRAVNAKLDELDLSGDIETKLHWIQERQKEVKRRYWYAQPLKKWLGRSSYRGEEEQVLYKNARLLEIKLRLAELGWEERDFASGEGRRDNQLYFLMCNAEPLLDKEWKELLPKLLARLKSNRAARVQREKTARRYERELVLRQYIYAFQEQLGPLARVITDTTSPISTSVGVSWNLEHSRRLLAHPLPSAYQASTWPELKVLLETDILTADFTAKLAEQHMLKNLIINWKSALEATLLALLPEDMEAQIDSAPGISINAMSNLSTGLQKLLRADAIFTGQDRLRFYPDDFVNTSLGASSVTYHIQAAKIANALLRTLNRPDASYLELKAMGRAFRCGRCHSPPRYMTWQEMIQHYINEADMWHQHSVAQEVRAAVNFNLIFTHEVNAIGPKKPLILVGIAEKGNNFLGHCDNTRRCKVCQSVLIRRWYHADYIIGHVHDVHLIEKPESGIHYS